VRGRKVGTRAVLTDAVDSQPYPSCSLRLSLSQSRVRRGKNLSAQLKPLAFVSPFLTG
jgi:hypothetical protein